MAKISQVDRAIAKMRDEINVLEAAISRLEAAKVKPPARVQTKLPKPGELIDRAILGGEPGL